MLGFPLGAVRDTLIANKGSPQLQLAGRAGFSSCPAVPGQHTTIGSYALDHDLDA